MTLNSLIESHAETVFLNTDHFAQTVTREIEGQRDYTASQTAIVSSDVRESRERGKAFVYDYEMSLASTDTVTSDDTYLVNSERCKVVRIGKAHDGMQTVYLARVESERTEARATRVLR